MDVNNNLPVQNTTVKPVVKGDLEKKNNTPTPSEYIDLSFKSLSSSLDLSLKPSFFLKNPEIISFVDESPAKDFKPIEPSKPKMDTITTYDEKNKKINIESKADAFTVKANYDDNNKVASSEIVSGDAKSNIKLKSSVNMGQNAMDVGSFGIETNQGDFNANLNYDSKAKELKSQAGSKYGTLKTTIDSDKTKLKDIGFETAQDGFSAKLNYDLASKEVKSEAGMKYGALKTTIDPDTTKFKTVGFDAKTSIGNLSTSYDTQKGIVSSEIQDTTFSNLKFINSYDVNNARFNKLGAEIAIDTLNLNSTLSDNKDLSVGLKEKTFDIGVNAKFQVGDRTPTFSGVEISKSINFGAFTSTNSITAEYDPTGNGIKKMGLETTAKINDKFNLSYSTKTLGSTLESHKLKASYNIIGNTNFSLEHNIDKEPTKSGFTAMLSANYKF